MRDVVCSELENLSSEWLAIIIEASFAQDATVGGAPAQDAGVEGTDGDASDGSPSDAVDVEDDSGFTGTVIEPAPEDAP